MRLNSTSQYELVLGGCPAQASLITRSTLFGQMRLRHGRGGWAPPSPLC